jgi:hypothetical protein
MDSNYEEGFKVLLDVDHESSLEERIECFKDSYVSILEISESELHSNPFLSLAYLSNIISSICDEEDYIYDEDDYLIETCQSIVLSDKLDDAIMECNHDKFKDIIKEFLLKNEKYELLNAIKNA